MPATLMPRCRTLATALAFALTAGVTTTATTLPADASPKSSRSTSENDQLGALYAKAKAEGATLTVYAGGELCTGRIELVVVVAQQQLNLPLTPPAL